MEFSKSSGPFQQSIYVFLHNVFFSLICLKKVLQVIAGNFLQDALENCWYYFIIGFSWCLSKVGIFQEKTADKLLTLGIGIHDYSEIETALNFVRMKLWLTNMLAYIERLMGAKQGRKKLEGAATGYNSWPNTKFHCETGSRLIEKN